MSISFRIVPHTVRPIEIVEVWSGDRFIASIIPGDNDGEIRVISKHLERAVATPPIVFITFREH